MNKLLTTDEAAEFLGMGKTKLYSMSREGHLPAKKLGKKWMYDRSELKTWLDGNNNFLDFFIDAPANIEKNKELRAPQRDAYLRALEFFDQGGRKAIIQLPVGCGKSGVAAILPFGIAKGRVLVLAPNLQIKEELQRTFDITNKQKCFWRRMQVLEDKHMATGPYVATLDSGNISVCEKSHIIVTNVHQLATNVDKWLAKFPADFFDMIVVDEAHHGAANSWKLVFEKFPSAKVVNLTATPFRSDRQEIDGELIFRYPFKSATLKGYIKKLRVGYAAPTELSFTVKGEDRTFTLDEVLEMKEETWFSKGVALSDPCNVSIVDNSLEKLEGLRQTGTKHQLIAVACSINHAQRIRSLYKERGYDADIIHSQQEKSDQKDVLIRLRNGTLDCIIQVQMLGEGFDHPKLSVAAIFRPFRSLAPYIQFVGRILRVVVQDSPNHPDNLGHIVTHIGMNLDEQLKKFKQFEDDDHKFWEEVTGGEMEPPSNVVNGKSRMKLHEDMVVQHEIVDHVFEEDFSSLEDSEIISDLENKLAALALDPALARNIVEQSKKQPKHDKVPAAQPFSVLPAKRWEEMRTRLNEEAKRTANIILNRTDLNPAGRELPFKLKPDVGGKDNFITSYMMVNNAIAKLADGKDRKDYSEEDFNHAMESLTTILNNIVREIKAIQNAKG